MTSHHDSTLTLGTDLKETIIFSNWKTNSTGSIIILNSNILVFRKFNWTVRKSCFCTASLKEMPSKKILGHQFMLLLLFQKLSIQVNLLSPAFEKLQSLSQ